MRVSNILFSNILFSLLFFSCKKENVGHFSSSSSFQCENYDWTLPPGATFPEVYEDSIQYRFPTVNPNNPFEVLYYKEDYINDTYQLIKYNYQTQQSLILLNNYPINNQPSWSVNGKIAYQSLSGKIYIIDENGSNETPFAVDYFDSKPFWSPNGESLLWIHVDQPTQAKHLFRKNINTGILDTLVHNFTNSRFCLSNSNQLLLEGAYLFSLDVSSGTNYTINDFNLVTNQLPGNTRGICWHPDGTKFYITKFFGQDYNDMGLFEVELSTGSITKLMDFCDKRWYQSIVCTPDGKNIIGQRVESYQQLNSQGVYTGVAYQYSSIYKINLQTLSEIKISP